MMKLNNKGYMLVEIIVASVIAFSIAYFLLDLVYNFKDKAEDIYESTQIQLTKTIITKTIMNDFEELEKDGYYMFEFTPVENSYYFNFGKFSEELGWVRKGAKVEIISNDDGTQKFIYCNSINSDDEDNLPTFYNNECFQKDLYKSFSFDTIKINGEDLTNVSHILDKEKLLPSNLTGSETKTPQLLQAVQVKPGERNIKMIFKSSYSGKTFDVNLVVNYRGF